MRVFIILALGLCLQSCYSVRFVSINGDEQPDPLSTRTDYGLYRSSHKV